MSELTNRIEDVYSWLERETGNTLNRVDIEEVAALEAELEAWTEKGALFVEQGDRLSKMEEALDIERLATIEHSQWMAWARTLMDEERGLSQERRERWQSLMVDYNELPDEIKEYDREWARIVIGEALTGESEET